MTREFILSELQNRELVEVQLKVPLPERSIGLIRPSVIPTSAAASCFIKMITEENPSAYKLPSQFC